MANDAGVAAGLRASGPHAAHSSATLTMAAQNQIKTGEVEEIHRGYVPAKLHPNAVRVAQLNCMRTG